MSSQPLENRSRDYFVTVERSNKVLEACPSAEWRVIFALARFGGLRCPSEILELRWQDIIWDQHRFMVQCKKTEGHEGHDIRFVPLWPEVRTALSEAWEQAEERAVYVVTKTRDSADNLRTQMNRIIQRAGIEPWPKTFQNLRATRATEVANEYGESKESKWIGHSRRVATKHYLQITDDDYATAAKSPTSLDQAESPNLEQSVGKALQNALQSLHAEGGMGSQAKPETPEKLVPASLCDSLQGEEWVYQDSNDTPKTAYIDQIIERALQKSLQRILCKWLIDS